MCSPNDPSSELDQCKQELQSCKEELEYYKTKSEEYHGLLQVCREKYESAQKQPEAVSAPPEKSSVESAPKKEKRFSFAGFMGGVKFVLMWLFNAFLYFVPLYVLPSIRWIQIVYTFLYVLNNKDLSGLACTAAYIYALVKVLQRPFLTRGQLIIIPCFLFLLVRYIIRYRQASKRF